MKLIRKIAFLAFAFLVITSSSNTLQAQDKYGYLNYGVLMEQFPEFIEGNKKFETYRDQLMADGTAKAKKFEGDVIAFQQNAQAGALTGVQIQEMQQKLVKEEQALKNLEQETMTKIGAKRNEILKPILDKIDKAVQDVGKENGYSMIFDASVINFIMYNDETYDVLPLVKKKLGI